MTISLLSFTGDGPNPKKADYEYAKRRHYLASTKPISPHFNSDPIRFTLKTDKKQVSLGDEVTFTITAYYLNISPALLFASEGSNAFRLKLLLPDDFVQTGGSYSDYVGTELSTAKSTISYTLKGYFTKAQDRNEFRLLRGSGNADETSLFVEKARLSISVYDHADQSKNARLASNCDYAEGQFLLNWYGEQIYAHYYNGILFASYQDPSQGFKPQSWLQATGFDASKVGCFAVNDPHTSNPTILNPPVVPPGNCGFTEGQFLLNWYGEQIYAHYYNGILFASYQDQSQGFKPQSWLQSTGFDANKISCFATSDPHTTNPTTPTTNPPVVPPVGTCSVSSPNAAFDFADCNGIGGWALDQANMSQPVLIDIYVDGVKTYAGITANGDRQDLVNAFGNSVARYHGFSYSFPANASWKNGQNHSISVRICGVNNEIGGSPKAVNGCIGGTTTPTPNPPINPPAGSCSVSSPRGSVDIANEKGIHGWALDESNMSKTVIIDIYINGTKVASVPADEDRSDLVSAFGNNSAARYHGFNIDLANLRYDPKNYGLVVQICGSQNPLWSGQVSFSARRDGDPEEPVDCGGLPEIVVKAKKAKWGYPTCNSKGQSGGTGGDSGNTSPTSPDPDIPPATNPETPSGNNPGSGSGTPNTNSDNDITSSNQPVPTIAILDVVDCEKISGWAYAKNGGYANLDIYISDIYGRFTKAATIRANTASRPDVRKAYNNNPNIPLDCGFVWGIPDGYKHGHNLTIKVVPANDVSPTGNITQSPMTTSGDCNNPNVTNPGGTTGLPVFTLPVTVQQVARFYINMANRGINFTDEERAVIAEFNLYDNISAYVNQYGSKPTLIYLSINLNIASNEQIKNAINNLLDPGKPRGMTDLELNLLGYGTPSFTKNLRQYYANAREATLRAVTRYGFHDAMETGTTVANAFKHSVLAIIHTQSSFGRQFSKQLVDAHESESPLIDGDMDRHNNEQGFRIYDADPNQSVDWYDNTVWNNVNNGLMRYMVQRLENGEWRWFLIPTNQH